MINILISVLDLCLNILGYSVLAFLNPSNSWGKKWPSVNIITGIILWPPFSFSNFLPLSCGKNMTVENISWDGIFVRCRLLVSNPFLEVVVDGLVVDMKVFGSIAVSPTAPQNVTKRYEGGFQRWFRFLAAFHPKMSCKFARSALSVKVGNSPSIVATWREVSMKCNLNSSYLEMETKILNLVLSSEQEMPQVFNFSLTSLDVNMCNSIESLRMTTTVGEIKAALYLNSGILLMDTIRDALNIFHPKENVMNFISRNQNEFFRHLDTLENSRDQATAASTGFQISPLAPPTYSRINDVEKAGRKDYIIFLSMERVGLFAVHNDKEEFLVASRFVGTPRRAEICSIVGITAQIQRMKIEPQTTNVSTTLSLSMRSLSFNRNNAAVTNEKSDSSCFQLNLDLKKNLAQEARIDHTTEPAMFATVWGRASPFVVELDIRLVTQLMMVAKSAVSVLGGHKEYMSRLTAVSRKAGTNDPRVDRQPQNPPDLQWGEVNVLIDGIMIRLVDSANTFTHSHDLITVAADGLTFTKPPIFRGDDDHSGLNSDVPQGPRDGALRSRTTRLYGLRMRLSPGSKTVPDEHTSEGGLSQTHEEQSIKLADIDVENNKDSDEDDFVDCKDAKMDGCGPENKQTEENGVLGQQLQISDPLTVILEKLAVYAGKNGDSVDGDNLSLARKACIEARAVRGQFDFSVNCSGDDDLTVHIFQQIDKSPSSTQWEDWLYSRELDRQMFCEVDIGPITATLTQHDLVPISVVLGALQKGLAGPVAPHRCAQPIRTMPWLLDRNFSSPSVTKINVASLNVALVLDRDIGSVSSRDTIDAFRLRFVRGLTLESTNLDRVANSVELCTCGDVIVSTESPNGVDSGTALEIKIIPDLGFSARRLADQTKESNAHDLSDVQLRRRSDRSRRNALSTPVRTFFKFRAHIVEVHKSTTLHCSRNHCIGYSSTVMIFSIQSLIGNFDTDSLTNLVRFLTRFGCLRASIQDKFDDLFEFASGSYPSLPNAAWNKCKLWPFSQLKPLHHATAVVVVTMDDFQLACFHTGKPVVNIQLKNMEISRTAHGVLLSQLSVRLSSLLMREVTLACAIHTNLIHNIDSRRNEVKFDLSSRSGFAPLLEAVVSDVRITYLQRGVMTVVCYFRDYVASVIRKAGIDERLALGRDGAGIFSHEFQKRHSKPSPKILNSFAAVKPNNNVETSSTIGQFRWCVLFRRVEVHLPANSCGPDALVVISPELRLHRNCVGFGPDYNAGPRMAKKLDISGHESVLALVLNGYQSQSGYLSEILTQKGLTEPPLLQYISELDAPLSNAEITQDGFSLGIFDATICSWCNQNAVGTGIFVDIIFLREEVL